VSKFRALSVPIVLLLALAVSFAASPDTDEVLDRRITLNLKEAAAQDLFGLFAQILDAELELEFDREVAVNFVFDEIKVRTSLNAFCESVGCDWELKSGDPPVLRFTSAEAALDEKRAMATETPISLDLEEASAPHVLQLFAEILKTGLAIDAPIEGRTVTIKRDNEPISTMLDEVCGDLGCRWELVGDGPITLRITAEE